jgi:glycosyltransferase involved in cell wall biosynthesis
MADLTVTISDLQAVYAIGARFAGPGIGHIAYQAARGLWRAGALRRLIVSSYRPTEIPAGSIRSLGWAGRALKRLAVLDPAGRLDRFSNALFDHWCAGQLADARVFHGWNAMCLESLRAARRRGMITVVERASSHPAAQLALLRQEYQTWGVPIRLPAQPYARALREMDEADYITIPSDFVRQSMLAAGVSPDKLVEIPFGADLSRFAPAPAAAPRPFRLIFAGQVSIRKGVPYLLEAWRRLRWDDAELWLAGGVTADFQAVCRRWETLAGIRYLGHRSDLPALLRACDGFVFPSIEEGSALVTYEAMACGLPIVTTPNAGSVARDGEEGFIVPPRDVEALAEALRRLRADAGLRRRMAGAAHARAQEYSWDAYQSRLLAAYRAMRARRPLAP